MLPALLRRAVPASALVAAALGLSPEAPPREAAPACFGAAARDPERPCLNPALRRTVVPRPAFAQRPSPVPCRRVLPGRVAACEFGLPARRAAETVALVGDSHMAHWRPAFAAVAEARRWRALSLSHSSCPLSTALRDLREPARTSCRRWKRGVFAWFAEHPEVRTVFVSGLSGGSGVVPSEGRSAFATSVAGYVAAWRALPATVERIVVVHDTPKTAPRTGACIERALGAGRPPGLACAVPRARALDPDPIAAAARVAGAPRVRALDMNGWFCGRTACLPVVGGALVHRDTHHLAGTFVQTLGPYLLRALEPLVPPSRPLG